MRNRIDAWTEDEDVYLEYFMYQGDGKVKEAAAHLGRSTGATHTRLTYLRNRDASVGYLKRRWTKEEDSFLEKNYKKMTYEHLAVRLNRTLESVKSRTYLLGLRKTRHITAHRERIIQLISEGYHRPEIARELDLDVKSLATFLRQNNIYCPAVPYSERTKKMKKTWTTKRKI